MGVMGSIDTATAAARGEMSPHRQQVTESSLAVLQKLSHMDGNGAPQNMAAKQLAGGARQVYLS